MANDTGHVDVPSGDEASLQAASVFVGPISVAIDAAHFSFQFYKTGVYDEPDCSAEQLDHGVLMVGYGVSKGTGPTGADQPYWIVKNRLPSLLCAHAFVCFQLLAAFLYFE